MGMFAYLVLGTSLTLGTTHVGLVWVIMQVLYSKVLQPVSYAVTLS